MELVWCRNAEPNFGDDLNEELWAPLAPGLLTGPGPVGFVGIGTVIGRPVRDKRALHVMGSGVGYDPPDNWRGLSVTFHAVRGPLSARVLGLDPSAAVTDGAVLTPLVPGFPQRAAPSGSPVVIPHFESLRDERPDGRGGWAEAARLAGFALLDPRGRPRDVVGRIAASPLVLTESLHGAILADAYGVPWIAFASTANFSRFKWVDWALSVGRETLRVGSVPPPDARTALRLGRPGWPEGTVLDLGPDEAMAAFRRAADGGDRGAAPRRGRAGAAALKAGLKALALRVPGAPAMLPFSAGRTAEALRRVARGAVAEARDRDAWRGELLERLRAVPRE